MYPKPKPKKFDPLRYLAGYFDTVEVNSTFYRPAAPEAARKWAERVNAFRAYPLAVEVRHVSWNDPAFYSELAERGMGFVNVDQPLFRNSIKPSARATSGIGYVRVHGRNYRDWFRKTAGRDERYDYLYTAKELEPWAERTRGLADEPAVTDVYVVNNNHFRGQAVANAAMLQSQVTGGKAKVPPPLFETYSKVLQPFAEPTPAGGAQSEFKSV